MCESWERLVQHFKKYLHTLMALNLKPLTSLSLFSSFEDVEHWIIHRNETWEKGTHLYSTFFKLLKWKNINKGWYNIPKVIMSTIVYIDIIILVSFTLDMGESVLTWPTTNSFL
jgi:hypothetical protein